MVQSTLTAFEKWYANIGYALIDEGFSTEAIVQAAFNAALEAAAVKAEEVGKERCESRGVNPNKDVFDNPENCPIVAMANESMACSEYISDAIRGMKG